MTLENSVEIWKIQNPTNEYFEGMTINAAINRDSLFNWLMYEYANMEVIDDDSGAFHDHVKYFFEIHDWNISKLVETTLLTYNPLTDYKWEQDRLLDRGVVSTDSKTGNKNVISEETENGTNSKTTSGQTDGTTNGTNSKTTSGKTDGTISGEWEEERKSNGSDINLVSAFNDLPATLNSLKDTERDRTVSETTQNNNGTNSETKGETTSGTESGTTSETTNETTSGTEQGTTAKTGTGTEDTVTSENANGKIDEDVAEHIERSGIQNNTYQSLIEAERKQAEFNIYKWIGRHFCKELLIAVW